MAASDIRAGKAYVEVYTRDNTSPGLKGIRNKLTSFAGSLKAIGGAALAAGAAATAAVMKAANYGSAVKDTSDRTGLSTDAVQELGYAARQTATDMGSLENGIKQMQNRLSEGSSATVSALSAVGLSLDELRGMSPDQQFTAIADAVAGIDDPARRVALAMDLFGKSGTDLIPMMSEGAGGIQRMRDQAKALGLVLSKEDIAVAEEFGDKIQTLKDQFSVVIAKIGVELIPVAEKFVGVLSDMLAEISAFIDWAWGVPAAGVPRPAPFPPGGNAPGKPAIEFKPIELRAPGGFGASAFEAAGARPIEKQQLEELKKIEAGIRKQKQAAVVPHFG